MQYPAAGEEGDIFFVANPSFLDCRASRRTQLLWKRGGERGCGRRGGCSGYLRAGLAGGGFPPPVKQACGSSA